MERAESLDEEPSGGFKDEVVGLEPGDEALVSVDLGSSEADEGMHLVQVAADRLGHAFEAEHQRVGGDLEQVALTVKETPDQRVEKRVALGVAVADDEADQVVGGARQGDRRGIVAADVRKKRRHTTGGPADLLGPKAGGGELAHGLAEAGEVGAGGKPDLGHAKRLSCSGGRTRRLRRSSRSRPGARWSAVMMKGGGAARARGQAGEVVEAEAGVAPGGEDAADGLGA